MKPAGRRNDEGVDTALNPGLACDPDAFRVVFHRYGKPILSFIYNILGDRARAEELTQETFVRAYAGLSSFRTDAHISTWLFGIARNVVREAIKEKSRRRQIDLGSEGSGGFIDPGSRPDEAVIASELRRAIRATLLGLRDEYRLVFILKVFNKMSYEEIAKVTGSSVGKLKTDLRRARLEMRHKLRAYLPESIVGL